MITTCTRCSNAYDSELAGAQAEIEKYRLREWACYQALGYSEPTNEALPHLIESMMGLKSRLQDSLASIERATGFQPGTEPLATWVEGVVKECDAAQKACAEMRQALVIACKGCECRSLSGIAHRTDCEVANAANHAMSDCGKDWRSPQEYAALEAKCAEMRMHCEQAVELLCQGSSGLQYDPSWCRPKTMPIVEMRVACLQAYHQIHKALSTDCGKDFVPRAELDKIKAQVKPLVEALEQCVKQCDYMPAHKGFAHAKELGL